MGNLKIIFCCNCNTPIESRSWNQKRCTPCRLRYEAENPNWARSRVDANKKARKRSGVCCSRCGARTGKPGICAKCSAYVLKWKASNRDKVAAIKKRRKSLFMDRKGRLLQKLLKAQNGRCKLCGAQEAKWHLDHIIPRVLGGCDEEFNFQVLCAFCNTKKGAKIIDPKANPDQFRLVP